MGITRTMITISVRQDDFTARKQLELIADQVSHFAQRRECRTFQLPCVLPSMGQTDAEQYQANGGVVDEGAC